MPEWLQKLLELVKFDFSANLLKTDKVEVNQTHITTAPEAPTIRVQGDCVEINISKLTPEQIKAVKPLLREAFDRSNQTFIASKTGEQIEELKTIEASPQSEKILSSLRSIISPEDYSALRSALFLRSQYAAGKNVYKLKYEIMQRFGDRGRKITNLCSAGYFDDIPDQLEKAKKSPGFTQDKFRLSFDKFVDESAFAIFVKAHSSTKETETQIVRGIKDNSSYGLQRLLIHGIGKENLTKIREAVTAIIKKHPKITKVKEEQVGDAILVDLEYPSSIHEELQA